MNQIRYFKDKKSDDVYGILLKEKDAEGRTRVPGAEAPKGWVRVKSCATNTNSKFRNIICGDEIAQEISIIDDDGNNGLSKYNLVGGNKIDKFTARDGSVIGVSFATGITEQLTQAALGFKHGGSLTMLDKVSVTAPIMMKYVGIQDEYVVFKAMENWKGTNFKTGSEIKYYITTGRGISLCFDPDKTPGGEIFIPGREIIKKSIQVGADDPLAKLFTMTKAKGCGVLGRQLPRAMSWTINSGKVSYGKNKVYIGDYEYDLDQDQLYVLPEGYEAREAEQLCSGVPDMVALKKLNNKIRPKDYGVLYAVFYYYIKSVDKFKKFNSEPLECLFKSIVTNDFDVQKAVENNPEFLNKLFHGGAIRQFQNLITEVMVGKKEGTTFGIDYVHSKRVEQMIEEKLDEVQRLEMKSKNIDGTRPTIRGLKAAKSFVQDKTYNVDNPTKSAEPGFDWSSLFNLMYKESDGKEKIIKWDWDKVRLNLGVDFGTKKNKDGSGTHPVKGPSVNRCKSQIKSAPNRENQLIELDRRREELINLLASLDSANSDLDNIFNEIDPTENENIDQDISKEELEEELKQINKQINKIKRSDEKDDYLEKWYSHLDYIEKFLNNYTNKDLKNHLVHWLAVPQGLPLSPYVEPMTSGIKLRIVLSDENAFNDDNKQAIYDKQEQIKNLKNKMAELDDSKESDKKEIEKLNSKVETLTDEIREIRNTSTPKILVANKNNWLANIIMGTKK